jgi:hypothetical protein
MIAGRVLGPMEDAVALLWVAVALTWLLQRESRRSEEV